MPRIRRDLLEVVEVVIPEAIEVGKRYIAKLKIKNTATFLPTIYRYNYTIEGEDEVQVKGTRDTIIKAGEEKEIEIERVAKKEKEHWKVEVFRGITPKNTLAEPQFVEEFDVPKEVVIEDIEITGFEITDPVADPVSGKKEIYAGAEFTGKVTIKNKITEHVSRGELKTKITQNSTDLGEVKFLDVELDPGEELSKEQVLTESVGEAGEYEVCAAL